MTRLGIVTGVYYKRSETQINHHIQHAFGGNTCVLAHKFGESPLSAHPYCIWTAARRMTDYCGAVRHYHSHYSLRVPHGRARAELIEFLQRQRVDALLAEFLSTSVYIAPVAEELQIPLYSMVRGADASSHLNSSRRVKAYLRLMPRLHGVFAVSQHLLDSLSARGISHANCQVIPSGVDTSAFYPTQKIPGSCLFAGRLIEKKRPDIVIKAFIKASVNFPQATLEIIGDGWMREDCQQIAQASSRHDRITFHGHKSHEFVRERMSACEIFLQPSMTARNGDVEGVPTTIQEAMASGMMILATRHAGIPEAIVEGECGLLSDEGDEAGFAALIHRVLSLDFPARELAANARVRAVKCFDRGRLLKKLEQSIAR